MTLQDLESRMNYNDGLRHPSDVNPRIHFVTLALDALPFVTYHLPVFQRLTNQWNWSIIEGVAAPKGCTHWVKDIPGRLSNDGTTEYLNSIASDPRIHIYRKDKWDGKCAMLNHALERIKEPCLLWQVDFDEIWDAEQIQKMAELFKRHPEKNGAFFWCRYHVGRDIVVTSRGTWGNQGTYEWLRVWRFDPGQRFITHEPPKLSGRPKLNPFMHAETEAAGLIFDHFAFATEQQVRFKTEYYAGAGNPLGHLYKDLPFHWQRLQRNEKWPARLGDFFPFVKDNCMVDKLKTV